MEKHQITALIENFANPSLAESWDCSGWLVETSGAEVKRVMLCLTVTDDVVKQARKKGCDMIISHHPLFYVPLEYKGVDIYCAHTNMDRADGGTTDVLVESLGLKVSEVDDFVRYVDVRVSVEEFSKMLCEISKNVRVVNLRGVSELHRIAFCAGSGSEFIDLAKEKGADAYVTGDLKFHTAVESDIALFDIGHFESEIGVLKIFEKLLPDGVLTYLAEERSPFKSL